MERTEELFQEAFDRNTVQVNRLIVRLMVVQWLFVIAVSLIVSPRTWIGTSAGIHVHVIAAIVLGGVFAAGPILLIRLSPTAGVVRIAVGVAQLLFSGLIIHVTGGRIESHFHIFASLALLAFYRDWRVLLAATAVTGIDHVVRGLFIPQSIYGIATPELIRTLEHVAWVVFADVFLLIGIRSQLDRMRNNARVAATAEVQQHRTQSLLDQTTDQLLTGEKLAQSAARAESGTRSIQEALNYLREAESTITGISGTISESARTTEGQMKQLIDQAGAQAAHVTQSSSAIEEMVAHISSVSEVAQRQEGAVLQASETVRRSQESSEHLSASVTQLEEAGSRIGDMVSVIDNVAARTQLLAMNAAIEAAHAGEAGRGFSVVASEIRSLSQTAGNQTREIKSQVKAIVESIGTAREAMDKSTTTYQDVHSEFESVRHAFSRIQAANSELSQGGTEILQAVSALREITQTVQTVAQETRQSQLNVTNAAENLSASRVTLTETTGAISTSIEAIADAVTQTARVSENLKDQLEALTAAPATRESERPEPDGQGA